MPKGVYERTPEIKAAMRGQFIVGQKAWNKGTHGLSPEPWNKNIKTGIVPKSAFKVGQMANENNYFWKGDAVSYTGLHQWVQRKLGTPSLCVHCGTTEAKRFEWANVSRQYKRDLSDWIRLCAICHKKYDNVGNKIWTTRRKNMA